MAKYLFRFGFCTPAQLKANEEHGWDDESSEAFFVEASTEESAESWGMVVAETFCQRLFKRSDWLGEIPSWKESAFAYWIETDLDSLPAAYLLGLPTVAQGQMPNFEEWELG
jgi:hypothetical protein